MCMTLSYLNMTPFCFESKFSHKKTFLLIYMQRKKVHSCL
ncbi:hypothetical protein B4129_2106 [Bacillus safensis]|nr:hypothetical protein B4129_2106 [Bacillus safensis]